MEVTPVTLRDVPVSSGVGADTQGRDTSHPEVKEDTTKKAKSEEFSKPEYPIDPRADALAARLRMADPQMDHKTAKKIAKQLLTPAARWEQKEKAEQAAPDAAHFDAKA